MTDSIRGQIDNVIVTVVCKNTGLTVDMRCPCHKPVELLGPEIRFLLTDEFGDGIGISNPIRLSFKNRPIPNGQTLASVGAWDGSYIYID